jgi:hypothetical protein
MSKLNTGTTNIPIPDSRYARWRRSTELCYLTAWQQMQPRDYRNPSDHDEMLNKEAVLMLTLIAALDYFVYDLIDEMRETGKYRFGNKKNITKVNELALNAHGVFYRNLMGYDKKGVSQYNIATEQIYAAINECVSLTPPERAYNIVVALCRLQGKQREKLGARYAYRPSIELDKVPQMLECLGIHDYNLDNIIEMRVRPIIIKAEYVGYYEDGK